MRHAWTDWSGWHQFPGSVTAATGHAWRERHCTHCTAHGTEMD